MAPFLTEAGLAKITGTGTDVYFPIPPNLTTPVETHQHLQRFLRDDFRFKKTFDIYAFLVLLGSASSTNTSWVSPPDLHVIAVLY